MLKFINVFGCWPVFLFSHISRHNGFGFIACYGSTSVASYLLERTLLQYILLILHSKLRGDQANVIFLTWPDLGRGRWANLTIIRDGREACFADFSIPKRISPESGNQWGETRLNHSKNEMHVPREVPVLRAFSLASQHSTIFLWIISWIQYFACSCRLKAHRCNIWTSAGGRSDKILHGTLPPEDEQGTRGEADTRCTTAFGAGVVCRCVCKCDC